MDELLINLTIGDLLPEPHSVNSGLATQRSTPPRTRSSLPQRIVDFFEEPQAALRRA